MRWALGVQVPAGWAKVAQILQTRLSHVAESASALKGSVQQRSANALRKWASQLSVRELCALESQGRAKFTSCPVCILIMCGCLHHLIWRCLVLTRTFGRICCNRGQEKVRSVSV